MISVYWPGKNVPDWLEKIEVTGNSRPWRVYHNGFGVVAKRRGEFIVWCIGGTFINIDDGGGSVKMVGAGRGVVAFFSFTYWWARVAKGAE